jgi:hypothetical protein
MSSLRHREPNRCNGAVADVACASVTRKLEAYAFVETDSLID